MLHSGIATTVLLVATRYLQTSFFSQASLETRFFPRQVPSLQVPAVDRDATPASHGDAVHDGDVGHRQLVDCQVQGVLLLQVGGLQVEYCCRDFLPFLFFRLKKSHLVTCSSASPWYNDTTSPPLQKALPEHKQPHHHHHHHQHHPHHHHQHH